jgi:glycosyltransferase involved in cell wall biosynthesis
MGEYGKICVMEISVIIPVLNEAESIGQVVASIPSGMDIEVVVVDGGSTDGSAEIAREAGAVGVLERRHGYGRACASGSAVSQGEILVFMDGDGADDPGRLPELITPLSTRTADLVLASRLAGRLPPGAMPWHQRLGNRLAVQCINLLYRQSLTDLSPFRAVRRADLQALHMVEMSYGWPVEMIVKAARLGWRIVEIPVDYRPRLGGRSKISGTLRGSLLAAYFILRTIISYARKPL